MATAVNGGKKRLAARGGERTVPEGFVKNWPPVDETDKKMVLASLDGKNHAFGPNNEALQSEFAEWNGNKFAINTNSGTAALHMCVAACGCGCGDEVIVPAYSWSSSATCILHHNAIPVFVDIDFDSMNIDPDKIESAITPKTKAIIAVHLHGVSADMDKILAVAERHNLKVIEDACQSHGALYGGKKVGTLGDCAAFSLNQNKCLISGEGGMFVTNNEEIYDKAKQLWSFGETRTPLQDRDYHAYALGWMYRGSDLPAAFGRAQLKKLDGYLETQKENAGVLAEGLKDVPGLILPEAPDKCVHTWYNYTIRFEREILGFKEDPAEARDKIMKALKAEGAMVSVWQKYMLPEMTVFKAKNAYGKGCPWSCPHAGDVEYNPENYPAAKKHSVSHVGMTVPLRAPNGPEAAKLTAEAFRKVMENLDEVKSL
jgi:perosamine synthetase